MADPQVPVVRTIHSAATLPSSDCDSSPKERIVPYANQNFRSAHPTGIAFVSQRPPHARWSELDIRLAVVAWRVTRYVL
jgi:hypothetical protein